MWRKTRITITLEPHLCMPCTNCAEEDVVVDVGDRGVGLGRRGRVEHRQEDAGDRLDDEGEERRRAERVEPVGPLRHLAVEHPGEEAASPPVRWSTQARTSAGASLARSARRCASDGPLGRRGLEVRRRRALGARRPCPGLAGLRSGAGIDRVELHLCLSRSGRWEGGRTRRVEVFPDAAGELAGVAGADRFELGGDAVARAELDLAVADAGLELVERAHRRAADPLALEVVDAAVAGADEVAGGLDEADRAAEVGAAVGDRDVRVGVLAELAGALADVGGGLAGVADALGFGEDDLAVGVFDEVARPGRPPPSAPCRGGRSARRRSRRRAGRSRRRRVRRVPGRRS